ncbi:glucan endo-1,3-beta-glucosidase 12-like [Brassica napus]|uniref:glucan endo-1,3-beta-glucosidase 12-like n=1 Tax=Brassica napus TaxID=3708 RepID=UPI0020787A3A|nr:glucan endo-1,3-beta-glucosidase 12-like [Brassica napus]
MKILKCDLLLIVIAVTVVVLTAPPTISAAKVGVTYSTPDFSSGSFQVSPERIVAKIVSLEIEAVRLLDPNPETIRAFASTNVSLFLSVPNPLVPMLASHRSHAFEWVKLHVLPFHNRTKISMISVGDDVSLADAPPPLFLLRAIRNVRRSLVNLGIETVSVSTTFSFFSIIPSPFPPSLARFRSPNGDVIIKPILEFLEKTNSSFLVKLHPYYIDSSIHSGFAFFEDPFSYVDDSSIIQVRYGNLFDVMVDAVVRSLAVLGHESLPVVVAETGWPSWSSNSSEVYATPKCSQRFLNALVDHLRGGKGTPLRKEGVSEVYIFELCDKQQSKRTWGLLDYHLNTKMNITFFLDDIPEIEKKSIQLNYLVIVCMLFLAVISTVATLTCCSNIVSAWKGTPAKRERKGNIINRSPDESPQMNSTRIYKDSPHLSLI